jgi:hypothetical protein
MFLPIKILDKDNEIRRIIENAVGVSFEAMEVRHPGKIVLRGFFGITTNDFY